MEYPDKRFTFYKRFRIKSTSQQVLLARRRAKTRLCKNHKQEYANLIKEELEFAGLLEAGK